MKDIYYTLYKAPYGLVKGKLREKMTFEEAEATGKKYCQERCFKYIGTYSEANVEQAQQETLQSIH